MVKFKILFGSKLRKIYFSIDPKNLANIKHGNLVKLILFEKNRSAFFD